MAAGAKMIKGLWNGIKSAAGWLKGNVQALLVKITNFFERLPDRMKTIGKNIVTGLWNGITAAGDWLKGKIQGFVDGVIGSFKSFFGIGSPSKEMADQIGKWLPAGMSEGITGNLKGLRSAVATMGDVVLNPPQPAFAGVTDEISNAIGTGLAVQNSGGSMPATINIVVELGGTKVGEKIVDLYDYTKRAKG